MAKDDWTVVSETPATSGWEVVSQTPVKPVAEERPGLGSPMGEDLGSAIMAAAEQPKPRKTYTGSVFDTVDITKLPEPEFNAEEAARLSRRAYAEQSMLPPRKPAPELKPTPKEEIDRSIGGAAMDTVIGVLQGAVSIPKGIVDNIPFDNPLSQFYKDAYEAGEKAKTGYIRSKNLERSALLERVRENQGELAASRAAFNTMFSPSGADIVAKGAGSMVAPLGLSLFNLGTKSMVAMNALANAGDAAQQAAAQLASMSPEDWSKSDVYQSLREKGLDHRDAVRILAPMYALPAQTVGAITGAVSGATGLEKALVKGGAQAVGSRLGRAGAETLGELSETLLPMVAGNAAQRLVDDRTNILKGTGQAAIETVAGALPGSALAAAAGERKPAVPTAEQMARERGFLVTPPKAQEWTVVSQEPAVPPEAPAAPSEAGVRAQQALERLAESVPPRAATTEVPIEEGVPSGVETPEAVKAEEERPEAPPAVEPEPVVEPPVVEGPVAEEPAPKAVDFTQYKTVKRGDKVNGLTVGEEIPNTESIAASGISNVMPGIRVVPMSSFEVTAPNDLFYSKSDLDRVRALAEEIKQSGRIDPLIVGVDEKGNYIIEGAHRLGALNLLGVTEFPAIVAIEDEVSFAPPETPAAPAAEPPVAEEPPVVPEEVAPKVATPEIEVTIPGVKRRNTQLASAVEENNWGDVSKQLSKSKNPMVAAIGKMADKLVGVTTQVDARPFAGKPRTVVAGYSQQTGGIYARTKTAAADEHAIAHETVHALTLDAIDNPSKQQKPAINRLKNLYRYVKTTLGERGKLMYGLDNEKEFIAEGMSNPAFQYELARIPYQKQTAWGAFTKTIADILGIKDSRALTELIAITEELTTPEAVAEEKAAPVEGKPEKPPVLPKPKDLKLKKGRNEQVVLAARELAAGRITKQEYDRYVDYYMPIEPVLGGKLEAPIEDDLMRRILTEEIPDKKDPELVNAPIADGTRVGLRMDIPALEWGKANNVNGSVVSIHKGASPSRMTQGDNISYKSTGHIKNVVFAPRSEEAAFKVAQSITGRPGQKKPQQTMEGNWINTSAEETMRRVKALLDDPNWTQVSLDPLRHSYFYARDSRRPVLSADEALQVGRFVLVKNPVYGKREDFLYVEIPEERPEERAGLVRQKESLLVSRDELGRRGFGAGAKTYDAVAKIANAVLDKISMKPISPELSRAMRNMKAVVAKAQKEVADVAGELGKLPEAERKMVSDVIEGELKAGVHPPQHVLNIAASMQDIMSRQSEELVRLKMLSPEAAARWENKYLPRFYETKLRDDINAWSNAVKKLLGRQPVMRGIRGAQLKSRGMYEVISADDLPNWIAEGWEQRDPSFDPKTSTETVVWRDYTREEREKMGEIRDAMFRFVMGYNASQRDIALGRLYEELARDYASPAPQEGYVRVPDTEIEGTMASRYGALSGMYVPKEIFDHLVANDEALANGVLKIYRAALRKWKEGKTVLNPVSHANNIISNLTMAHFAGVSYWDGQKYAGAIRDLVKNDPMVKEAQDVGLFGGTFNQSELVDSMPPELRALANKTESQAAKIGEGIWDLLAYSASYKGKKYGVRPVMQWAYDAEDQFFRYLIYRDARQKGLDPEDAREYSQQFIFTYDDLPAGARALRDYGMPFFSYTYKVVPVLARTALEYPWRYAAPAAVAYAANAMMYSMAASLGGNDDDWWGKTIARYVTDPEFRKKVKDMEAEERRKLPEWMKGHSAILATPKAIRMGVDEATGLPLFLDISRIFPGGDLLDANNNSGGVALLQPLTPSNPVLTTLVAMLANKDMFYGKDVVKASDTEAEKARKRADWLWKQITPAISVGNYHFDRGMNVLANMTGKPITIDAGPMGVVDYTGVGKDGLPVQPKYALAQTFGIKVRPYDLEISERIEEANKAKLIKEISAEISRLNRLESKGAVSPETAEKLREEARVKRSRLKEGLTVEGKEKD